jgi:hypothetical protein
VCVCFSFCHAYALTKAASQRYNSLICWQCLHKTCTTHTQKKLPMNFYLSCPSFCKYVAVSSRKFRSSFHETRALVIQLLVLMNIDCRGTVLVCNLERNISGGSACLTIPRIVLFWWLINRSERWHSSEQNCCSSTN